jgi:lipopolysaccharide/colanic/teichoic acid biosynthesis glycosyltransferase
MLKRVFDLFFSSLGLIILLPCFVLISVLIKLDSQGPVFFRQERVGLRGSIFRIHKFRTMISSSHLLGPRITVGDDSRITRIGKFLRHYKLDELPQLIDVFRGKMSLVGPRPELIDFTLYYPPDARAIIQSVRPGITDKASVFFKDESLMLLSSLDPTSTYIEVVLPIKIRFYVDYVETRTFLGDICIILYTIYSIIKR